MNRNLRGVLERMRKFSECLIGILGENRKNWGEIIPDCYTIKQKFHL